MNKKPETMWAIYEANVQQYRILSATVQSFLLAVGTMLYSTQSIVPSFLLNIITLIGLLHIIFIWIPIVRARSLIVDYYKYQYYKDLKFDKILELKKYCSEHEYVNNPLKRKEVNKAFYGEHNLNLWRMTRLKIDLITPFLYALIWILLWLWKYDCGKLL